MSVFKDYAAYYDLLYKDKNYRQEAEYIHQLIKKIAPGAKTILNLGCGTGSHDFFLAELGYEVTGVDLSVEMIDAANAKLKGFDNKLVFLVGDVRSVDLHKQFDVVISLFHVMSYQVTNQDLRKAFETSHKHLTPNGIFIFDCWYGPGVLLDLPQVRYRVLENGKIKIHRIAEPSIHLEENYVDVNYTLLVNNKEEKSFYEVKETHKMRYLFQAEVKQLAFGLDWQVQQINNNVFSSSWNAFFVCSNRTLADTDTLL